MDNSDERDPLDVVAEQVLARVRAGEQPSLSEFVKRFPEHEAELKELFPALLMMERFGAPEVSAGVRGGDVTDTGHQS